MSAENPNPTRRLSEGGALKAAFASSLATAIELAEKYFDRFEASEFLAMLPREAPLSMLTKFLTLIIEFGNTKKRNLQVDKEHCCMLCVVCSLLVLFGFHAGLVTINSSIVPTSCCAMA
jgi:hypothetical protein